MLAPCWFVVFAAATEKGLVRLSVDAYGGMEQGSVYEDKQRAVGDTLKHVYDKVNEALGEHADVEQSVMERDTLDLEVHDEMWKRTLAHAKRQQVAREVRGSAANLEKLMGAEDVENAVKERDTLIEFRTRLQEEAAREKEAQYEYDQKRSQMDQATNEINTRFVSNEEVLDNVKARSEEAVNQLNQLQQLAGLIPFDPAAEGRMNEALMEKGGQHGGKHGEKHGLDSAGRFSYTEGADPWDHGAYHEHGEHRRAYQETPGSYSGDYVFDSAGAGEMTRTSVLPDVSVGDYSVGAVENEVPASSLEDRGASQLQIDGERTSMSSHTHKKTGRAPKHH